ncbi:hypothetical protein COV42_01080 [Candidatus Campbellbacteria bacterium CG11_big_fil_rev_8_21_14_0_20_44_21]|uniref:Phospholipid/glycerol acyltransferase domain-containing protein n=1 Tax=Candidatus Campbellbacteria bacterium CG22_combo_CG10-13_8_21_14_all_43_18 TaxID=1974530 RepID=A0A2H0DX82_9BACT|nr:MAG: hypothetical protein COW82_00140 [Candidatus Campbellbacteria bacterium CG22_combo_CG10-13_8_21_14_all_43_18]PIR24388.1 MAG: hypothetical protein COV42_01080 [Candidatus Campbellbacteria bacterium CG11_big_fil_rev_8_21_14_0_20_44_21]
MKKYYFISPFILQTLIWIPCFVIFRVFTSIRIKGLGNLKGLKRGLIFAPNHTSELDPILVPASLPFFSRFMPMFYTSREKSFYVKSGWRQIIYGGLFFKAWGSYAVRTGKKDYKYALKNHIQIIRDKGSVCIFPEGKRTMDGNLKKARGGIAFLSYRTNVPIVPIAIGGLYNLSLKSFLLRKHKFTLTFGKPIYSQDLMLNNESIHSDFEEAAEKIMEEIARLLGKRA